MERVKALGTPASFWNNRERRYREALARLKERKRLKKEVSWMASFPIREMIKSEWIKRHKDKIDQVDELLCFFGVKSSLQWEKMCVDAGVAVVFTPQIKGAPIYGVTRWLTADKAMIQLSLRGKFEDLLWFTFFHEAGHILLHGKKEIFIEGSDNHNEKEQAADKFATNFLIPSGAWQKFLRPENYKSKNAVEAFAAQLEVSPAIVVGRLQHEGLIPYSHLNGLRRRFEIKAN